MNKLIRENPHFLVSWQDCDLADLPWSTNTPGYLVRREGRPRRYVQMHRLILERMVGRSLGRWEITDHRNGLVYDNRRSNLRMCSQAENGRHRTHMASHNTSGYRGVCWHKQHEKWNAKIRVNGKSKSLGLFDDIEAAHAAYVRAAEVYFGEFAGVSK